MYTNKIGVLIDEVLENYDSGSSSPLIPILQEIQNKQGFLSSESLEIVSRKTGISPSRVYGVATFYHQFRLKPEGKHKISICKGTACHVAGVESLYKELVNELNLKRDEDTSDDGLFTVHEVRCLGACSLAPVIKIDETVYGKMTPKKLKSLLKQYREKRT